MPEVTAPAIPGAEEIVRWFGKWPTFHDAEVLEIDLKRKDRSSVRLHAFRITNEVDAEGHLVLDLHAVVTFWLDEVTDLELADFSHQNVIFGLAVEPVAAGFRLALTPCYGIAGYIEAAQVSVSLEPGRPEERA
jgi:hypothetical protein